VKTAPTTRPARARKAVPDAASEILRFGAREVVVTHPDRILFPADAITKGDLVHYYRDVADWILPYVANRPLTLQRWPEGIEGFSFFEKKAPKGLPDWIATTMQPRADGAGDMAYPMANDAASLAWFANLASITFHVWASRVGSIQKPDYLLFDLDPSEDCAVRTLADVALHVRDELAGVGLTTFVKTTGGKGLHVVAPLGPHYSYDDARAMNEVVARRIEGLLPEAVTLERAKAKRGRAGVYFDWAQLGLGKTVAPPFTVRARPGAPVSMPIVWSEVEKLSKSHSKRPTPEIFAEWNLKNVPALLAEGGDPWKGAFAHGQRLEPALDKARTLWRDASHASDAVSKTTRGA